MPLRIDCKANDSDKHVFDINHLLFHKGKLYSGADDGKIKVTFGIFQLLIRIFRKERFI